MTDSQMDAPELLPCPFCGERAEIWRAHEGRTAWIACMGKCSVLVSKEYKTDAEAIAAWNRRATPTVLAADPAVKALIADAEARAAREAYRKACVAVQIVISRNTPDDGGDADPCLIDQLEAVEGLIKREAAALRGETP